MKKITLMDIVVWLIVSYVIANMALTLGNKIQIYNHYSVLAMTDSNQLTPVLLGLAAMVISMVTTCTVVFLMKNIPTPRKQGRAPVKAEG